MPETRSAVDVRSATPTTAARRRARHQGLSRSGSLTPSPTRTSLRNGGGLTASPAQPPRWTFASGGRTGSRWSGRAPSPRRAQFSHHMGGEYHEIDRPHRLVMSGRAVNDEQGELFATLIEVTFEARDGGAALTVRQSYFEPNFAPAEAMAGAQQGWSEQLEKLQQLLAD